MYSVYLLFTILFIVNNILHQISEKIVIIVFIFLFYLLYISFKCLIMSNYTKRITDLLRELHLYVDSLFLLAYLSMYLILRISYVISEANTNLLSICSQLSKFNCSLYLIRSHLNKTSFIFGSVVLVPSYSIYPWLNEYSWICLFALSAFLISSILVLLSYILVYQEIDIEKNSAYECGFQPFSNTRNKFNVKYYLVAIVFMIFDLEIMYLFPWAVTVAITGLFGVAIIILFLCLLVAGFFYEWKRGALDWD